MPRRALLDLVLEACPTSLKPLRQAMIPLLDRLGLATADRDLLVLVLNEAFANVVRHAYGNCGHGRTEVRIEQVRGALRFRMRDYADPCDPAKVKPRDLSDARPGGLGINFIDETMQRWRLRPLRRGVGNTLIMYWRPRRGAAASTGETE